MEAAAAMDFHALSRRELQALCKRNGVRANMTNAAMAEALQGLTSVDGIDEIGTTLCLPTPGRSAMKSAANMVELGGEEQQHGSPLPRGRRVSVKSPEAIRMEVEEGEDETKRDLVKEIVRTPGVALRSTSRRARATPAPLPTPVPASSARGTTRRAATCRVEEVAPTLTTLRRSQRTASRKAAEPVEAEQPAEDVSAVKRPTRSARSKVTMALDQEEDVAAAASKVDEKVQQEEPDAVASDVKCDEPDEDEVTKLLEGDSKDDEPEEGDEADSSDVTIGCTVASEKSCDDTKMEEVVLVMEEPHEGIVEEKEPVSAEKPVPLATMEDSPILGVLSKAEASETVIEKAQDASLEDDECYAEWSPVAEITDDSNVISEEKVSIDEEAVKEDACTMTDETNHSPEEVLTTAADEDETNENNGIMEVKEGAADEMLLAGLAEDETNEESEDDGLTELREGADEISEEDEEGADETSEEDEEDNLAELTEGAAARVLQAELAADETSEVDGLAELKEGAPAKMPLAELTDGETSEEDEEWASDDSEASEDIDCTDESDEEADQTDEECDTVDVVDMLQGTVITEEANEDASVSEDIDCSDESDEEADQTDEECDTADVVDMLQGTVIAEKANEDASTEDDDFSGDLPPEFDNVAVFSDSETESDIAPPVLEENKAALKSLDDSAITEEKASEEADATEKAMKEVDSIVKCLDEFTIEEGAKEMQKLPQVEDYKSMSLRKLQATLKRRLIAAKAGKEEVAEEKRLPLEEVDENTCGDC